MVAIPVIEQAENIYKTLIKENPNLKDAIWYNYDSIDNTGLEYELFKVEYDDLNKPSWEKKESLSSIVSLYDYEDFEKILKVMISRS